MARLNSLDSLGALHTPRRLRGARIGIQRVPIKGGYRGFDVYQAPPNNPGVTALLMLRIGRGLRPRGSRSVGGRAASPRGGGGASRLRHARRPTSGILPSPTSPSTSSCRRGSRPNLRARIDPAKAMDLKSIRPPTAPDTVYLCVVDSDRNAISFINSLSYAFGTGLLSPDTGVMLQNRGAGFRVEPGHPNCIAPRKRAAPHDHAGNVGGSGDRVLMPYGVMGGAVSAHRPYPRSHQYPRLRHGRAGGHRLPPRLPFRRQIPVGARVSASRTSSAASRALGHETDRAGHAPRRRAGDLDRLGPRHAGRRLRSRKDGCALGY